MLTITIPATEMYDEKSNQFFTLKEQTLQLEHSLVSLSKWESKWCKPFLSKEDKTAEETIEMCVREVMKRVNRELPNRLKNLNLN